MDSNSILMVEFNFHNTPDGFPIPRDGSHLYQIFNCDRLKQLIDNLADNSLSHIEITCNEQVIKVDKSNIKNLSIALPGRE